MYAQATLYDYWMALYSRKGIILLTSLSTMVFTLLIGDRLPPIYEAKATMYFPVNNLPSSYVAGSPHIMAQPALRPNPDDKEAGIHVGILRSSDMAQKVHALFPGKDRDFFKTNVDFVTSPQFFTDIYVRDRDPELAARIANSYVEIYSEFHVDVLKRKAERAHRVLESELADIEKLLSTMTAEISRFKQQNRLVSSADAEQLVVIQTQQLDRDRNDAIVALRSIQEQILSSERSGANVAAGGRERMSALVHGILLVLAVVVAASLLNLIPLAALAAVLIQVGLNLCKPALFSSQVKLGWTQLAPFALTIIAVLTLDLLKGVIVGVIVGIGFVLFQNARGALESERAPNGSLVLRFRRDGTFLSKPGIIAMLDALEEGERVVIDGTGEYIDHDVKEVLAAFLADAPRRNILATVTGIDLSMAGVGGGH